MGALFDFHNVSLTRGRTVVFDGVSFSIPDGGITVVTGPSGSGKSSLLRLCNRLDVPDGGDICFRGDRLGDLEPCRLRQRVGMVFQQPIPLGGTVADAFALVTDEASRWSSVLDRVGLDPTFLDRPDDELSGGEGQRMCLARTLLTDPEALLMDEPTASLDVDAAARIEGLARSLAADGTPVVWVSHSPEQRLRLADAWLELSGGTVVDHLAGT